MALTDLALDRLTARGLDVEHISRRGFDSVIKSWPVEEEGGRARFEQVEALVIPIRRNGEVVRRKFKAWNKPEGAPAYLQDKGGLRIAYNEDCLREERLFGKPLVVTEGELDAEAAIQCGVEKTISVPDGAPPPGDRDAKALAESKKYDWVFENMDLFTKDRCPEIILATDGDANGAALLQDLSVIFGRFRCKFVTYPLAKKDRLDAKGERRERCKDLNEVLEDYGAKGVQATIERAQWLKIEGVFRMSELPPPAPQVIYEPRHELLRQHYKVRLGDFSVWTGVPGFGKSTLLNDVLCGIAHDNNITIAWASFEQDPARDHKRNLQTWFCGMPAHKADHLDLAAANRWIDERHLFLVPREDEDASLDWLLDKMEVAVARYGAKIIVIDPWNELEHSRRPGESETEYIGRAIRTLKRFAKAFGVHVVVVAHPTKSTKDNDGNYLPPTLYDISGSANWYNKCDLGVIVHRINKDDTSVKTQKSRYHEVIGRPGEVIMQFSKDERKFIETERGNDL